MFFSLYQEARQGVLAKGGFAESNVTPKKTKPRLCPNEAQISVKKITF